MSKSSIRGKAKAIAWLCTLVYFGSYITRQNFNVMQIYVIQNWTSADPKDLFGTIITVMTITYGVGQVVCGFLGDKIKPQYMLTGGLALASITNILMAVPQISVESNIVLMAVIWGVNGFAHSMLWPPIVRIMSMYLTDEEYGYSAVRVSWGSQFATIILYLGCPTLIMGITALSGTGNALLSRVASLEWRGAMLVCAAIGIIIDVVWVIFYPKLLKEPLRDAPKKSRSNSKSTGVPIPAFVIAPLVCIFFGIIFQGVLRDGITNWTPTLLKESFGLEDWISTMLAVLLAVFAIFSFSVYEYIHKKFFKNEVFCAAMIFGFSAVMSAIVLLMFVFEVNVVVLFVLLEAIIVGNMHGINLMLITVVPKRFVRSGKVSLFSGVLNACTYIGAAVGTMVFAMLSGDSWIPVIISWIVVSILGLAVCLIATPLWKKFRREYADYIPAEDEDNDKEADSQKQELTENIENK